MDFEKALLRKVGEAVGRFKMIREGDRIAVGVSGGKDSVTLLEALLLLQKRAPIDFTVQAFTVEQGKFLAPVAPIGEYIQSVGVQWTYYKDKALNCNVIALGHTADDFCESLFRNIMFTGRMSALPPVTWSKEGDFRLIRPLVLVNEEITRGFVEMKGVTVVPCGCSQKTGTVRRSIRDTFAEWQQDYPHLQENILGAMGRVDHSRLLDTRYLNLDEPEPEAEFTLGGSELLPVLQEA